MLTDLVPRYEGLERMERRYRVVATGRQHLLQPVLQGFAGSGDGEQECVCVWGGGVLRLTNQCPQCVGDSGHDFETMMYTRRF